MAVSLVLLPAILSHLIVLSESSTTSIVLADPATSCERQQDHHFICELEETKVKISRLESILEETIQGLNSKTVYLKESENIVEEMSHEVDHLRSAMTSLKGESLRANERLNHLEEEVRLLWAALRKTNFELHVLKSKSQDAENRLELVASQVETMAAIVTEQWIQIQQLEQALHIAEMRALKARRQLIFTRCTFLKFVRDLFENHLQKLTGMLESFVFNKESALGSYISQTLHQLERILSAAKKYHHELQGLIMKEMEKNEFTAPLANKEVVFFVASALITFPIMSAWMLLSSQFS